ALEPKNYLSSLPTDDEPEAMVAINLPNFAGILSHFTNPNRCFADELSDRIKVVACIDKPNLTHSEESEGQLGNDTWDHIRGVLSSKQGDAQLLIWGPLRDMETAIETIEERCKMAFEGVPNETRKALADGTTLFERVLPGPDRMYPDTDSAPIPLDEAAIEQLRATLPRSISACLTQMREWNIPEDCHPFILKRTLFPLLEKLVYEGDVPPVFAGTLLGHTLRAVSGDRPGDGEWILTLADEIRQRGIKIELLKTLLPIAFAHPQANIDELLDLSGYSIASESEILEKIPELLAEFSQKRRRDPTHAQRNWIMGRLRPHALGNMSLADLAERIVEGGVQ
ncbi:Glu-tRNA(Gln) amidotransferase GatDE subunit E, partial [Candidatus Bipolaricaulota bacterium]|nr:Glu-tRNA(Gln) amidotransferase GatDE subunit E [Candidatus Bipolaricaulota bacterium]